MVRVENYCKAYDGVPVVNGVSFDVSPGDVLGLVGPNGAGKTTTMKAVSGMLPPTRGALSVAGIDVALRPVEVRSRVAWLPDAPQLFSDLTIEEHLAFTMSAYQIADGGSRLDRLLEAFDLSDHVLKTAGELSRGMRQKLAICCAYLRDPDVLIFDEPFTGLDPRGIRWLKTSIEDRAGRGAAVIVSSHLLAMVEDVCTHLLLLNAGEQSYFGPLGEIRATLESRDETATLEEIFLLATDVRSEVAARNCRSFSTMGAGER